MRILLSKPDALGDQVLTTALVQALRRHWPQARIVWHVRSGMEIMASVVADAAVFTPRLTADPAEEARRLWAEVSAPIVFVPFPIDPYTDWTSDLEGRFGWWGRFIAATTWDLALAPVVNRTGLSDFTVTISGAPQRIGFTVNGACQPLIEAAFTHLPKKRADFTQEVRSSLQESEWTQLARLLAAVIPDETLRPPALRVSPEAAHAANRLVPPGARLALLAPGVGRAAQRAWPVAGLLRIAGDLRQRSCDVRWIEGPHDAAVFSQFPEAESPARIRVEADRLDVLVALISRASLLVCNDTSYVHLGAALHTPTVAVFGAGQKGRFVPAFGRVRVVQGDPVCRGCQWQCAFDRLLCVQDVPYESVRNAVAQQLSTPEALHERLAIFLPYPEARNRQDELERVRDWFQEELDRLRWDGWARLQIINDVLVRLQARDAKLAAQAGAAEARLASATAEREARISALTTERDVLATRLRDRETAAERPAPAVPELPKLSVIIPMGRPERAAGTLQALERQTLRPPSWEVVVVGVGASRVRATHPQLPLVPVDLERNVLPPRTRVEGVKRATGDWYIFVDDDVQLAPDFFEMLARVLAPAPALTTPAQPPVGAIGVRLPGGRGTYFEHLTDISNFWSQQSPIRAVPHTVWFLYSAAIVVRAEAYHKSGGFNPELPNGEDVDLTQRIKAAGYILAYEPSLVAYHHHGRDTMARMWRYFWRNGNAAQYFFAQLGGVCCYSIRTVLKRTWLDLRMNRSFQKTQAVRLGLRVPWILLNYLIVESSLEWHWQEYLWRSRQYEQLPAKTTSDRTTVRAFRAAAGKQRLRAVALYALAMVQNLTDPVRR